MIIHENIPISKITTMRLGGPARYLIDIESTEDIEKAVEFAEEKNLPIRIIGGGANTIGHDEGFNGVLIRNAIVGIEELAQRTSFEDHELDQTASSVSEENNSKPTLIKAMGGTEWDAVVEYSVNKNLTGIEGLSKIPGLAGAAPVQNIGAYGQDASQTFVEADVYDLKTKSFKTLSKDDFHFDYRKSILNTTEKNRYFVISITLELHEGQMSRPFYNSIERYIEEHGSSDFSPAGIREIVSTIRADKLPDPKEIASAGSFFKNVYLTDKEASKAEEKGIPVYRGHDGLKINSGWLIEQCGLKGKVLHGIRVNDKAALVLINESAKDYNDLAKARTEITNKVYETFGYKLEQEPIEL